MSKKLKEELKRVRTRHREVAAAEMAERLKHPKVGPARCHCCIGFADRSESLERGAWLGAV